MSFEARQVAIKQRNTTDNGAGGETVTYGNTSPAQTAVACYRSYRSPAGVTQYSEAGPGVIQEIEAIYFFDLPLPTVPALGQIWDGAEVWGIRGIRTYDEQIQVDVEKIA